LDEWVSNYPAKDKKLDQAVRLPFWAGAIFARSRGKAQALPEEIARCRQQAVALRRRRAELEAALQQSRIGDLASLAHAVSRELDQLATWVNSSVGVGAATVEAVATATLKAHAPVVPSEVVAPITKAADVMSGSKWLKKLALKLFQPHVYFVYSLSQDAGQLGDVLRAAAQVFPLGGRDASQPAAFLIRLGRTEWLI
jgi:hypothetical protein